jgi:ubiquinone/menaquinone biosynthesis C-methylase UbiE
MNDREQSEMDTYMERTLDETAPALRPFLGKGNNVLDVGCGPGTITLDVARAVTPGRVVGFDHVEHRIAKARSLAVEQACQNASFEIGDANELPYDDETFDVVYSHTVLHYFWNPEHALSEQKRVLKNGGWLVAAGVRDVGLVKRYPECPMWDAVLQARIRFSNAVKDRKAHFEWDRRPCLAFHETGRRCPEWFSRLGMRDIQVNVEPYRLQYRDADGMEPSPHDLLPWGFDDPIGYHADYGLESEAMIDQGFLDRDTLALAMSEAKQWFNYPGAFHFSAMIHVAGRK